MQDTRIEDYDYELPQTSIAQYALEPRDSSKLLVYSEASIADHVFTELPQLLPSGSTLFFNDARVIPARLFLKTGTGANIEVFLLQPYMTDYASAMNARGLTKWKCLVGNKRKWKGKEVLKLDVHGTPIEVSVEDDVVAIRWQTAQPFIELLEAIGTIPLPPYIRREASRTDQQRYQTVYAKVPGSVAAPTAGLHFTQQVLDNLRLKGIAMGYVTLHVGAGTFLPVKVSRVVEHKMHAEVFSFNRRLLEMLRESERIIAVGTTTCRVLESLYWCAVKISHNLDSPLQVSQSMPYDFKGEVPAIDEALDILHKYLDQCGADEAYGETSIMIMPGYEFRFVKGLVTNFHQPKSTLLLLISALVGDKWQEIYQHALNHGYRFLSYGDSSLLIPQKKSGNK